MIPGPFTSRDKLFFWFSGLLTTVMLLTGASAILVIVFGGADTHVLALRLINVFAAMFTGVLGLGSGYILGANRNGNGH